MPRRNGKGGKREIWQRERVGLLQHGEMDPPVVECGCGCIEHFVVFLGLLRFFMAALRCNGQAIMFYSCDLFIYYYLFISYFSRFNLRGRGTPPRGTFARMSECGVIL